MTFFNPSEPLVRRKQEALDVQDLEGLLRINLRLGRKELFSSAYTRVDQAFLLWGAITAIIFVTAQFYPISWQTQAIAWSVLTVIGSAGMMALTYFWAKVEHLRWVVFTWVVLMNSGVAITDWGIFLGIPSILINLCLLWLSVSAAGYWITGIGLRSRALVLCGTVHVLSIFCLPYVAGWQFLFTGIVIAISLLLLAEMQWDMRPPIDSKWLSEEQKVFNQHQQQRRHRQAH
jgi:hypothetical protein